MCGDGAGVPALGEHRHRHHAAGGAAEPVRDADGVHHFAQQVLVGEAFGLTAVAGARDDLTPEALDLVARRGPEVAAESFAGVELLAVDQAGCAAGRAGCRVRRSSGTAPAFRSRAKRSRPHVGDETRRCSRRTSFEVAVLLHTTIEAGRHFDAGLAPLVEDLRVVAVERFEGGLQLDGNAQRVERRGLGTPPSRHLGADVLPQVAERGHLATGDVVRHRHARQLDDAALDRVPSARSRSSSRGTACPPRSRSRAGRTAWPTNRSPCSD